MARRGHDFVSRRGRRLLDDDQPVGRSGERNGTEGGSEQRSSQSLAFPHDAFSLDP
jgi:hypothetical protein